MILFRNTKSFAGIPLLLQMTWTIDNKITIDRNLGILEPSLSKAFQYSPRVLEHSCQIDSNNWECLALHMAPVKHD